jgi:hypothetical protein
VSDADRLPADRDRRQPVRDRIIGDGLTYEVVGPPVDAGGRGRHLELELLLVVP